jgi:hypothetical protein
MCVVIISFSLKKPMKNKKDVRAIAAEVVVCGAKRGGGVKTTAEELAS